MSYTPSLSDSESRDLLDNIAMHPTPEGLMLTLMPAGIMPRLTAWLIDFGIRSVITMVLMAISAFFGTAGVGVLAVGYFLITWLYPVYFEVFRRGMTPGKKNQGIYVCHDDGTPISLPSSMIRNLLRVADFLPFGFAAGALTVMFTPRSQRIGDIVAGTLVVYKQQDNIEKLYKSIYGLIARQPDIVKTTASIIAENTPSSTIIDAASPLFFYPLQLSEQQALVSYSERLGFLSEARQQEIAWALAPLVTTKLHSPQAKKEAVWQAVVQQAMRIQGQEGISGAKLGVELGADSHNSDSSGAGQ